MDGFPPAGDDDCFSCIFPGWGRCVGGRVSFLGGSFAPIGASTATPLSIATVMLVLGSDAAVRGFFRPPTPADANAVSIPSKAEELSPRRGRPMSFSICEGNTIDTGSNGLGS